MIRYCLGTGKGMVIGQVLFEYRFGYGLAAMVTGTAAGTPPVLVHWQSGGDIEGGQSLPVRVI